MMRITPAKDKLELKHFRVISVVDKRLDKNSIGYLTTGAHNYFLQANFRQPLEDEFTQFFTESTQQNPQAEPVVLHVNDYFLHENASMKGAEIAVNCHYTLYTQDGRRLQDYSAVDTRNTGMNMAANAGELMRRNVINYLSAMDQRLPATFAALKKDAPVKVTYTFIKEPAQKHLLPYNPQRPLNVYHFVAKAPADAQAPSHPDAGLIVNYQVRNLDGNTEALVEILPYFNQATSWLKAGTDVPKNLKYAQTYFKISAFVTNELIKELKEKQFTFSTLQQDMDALREKYISQVKALQEQYLAETDNGNNLEPLDKWSRQIAFYPAYASK